MEKVDYINVYQYDENMASGFQLMFCIYNFENKTDTCMDVNGRLDIISDILTPSKYFKQFSFTLRK